MLVYLALAGALAAALAALASSLVAIAAILAEDVVHGLPDETAPDGARIGTARVALLGAAFVTAWLAIAAPADPLQLFLWSLTFSASASFPVLVLAIWVEADQRLGRARRHDHGLRRHRAGDAARARPARIGLPSALAGAVGLPLATGRGRRRQQADAGARAQRA